MRHNSAAFRRGMALMDVIIGAVILGIGLAVLMSLSSRSLAAQSEGEHQIVAAYLADELLNMVVVEGPVDYPRRYDTAGWFGEPFQDYFYDLAIQDEGLGVPYRVTATVGWNHGRRTQSVQVQTQIAAHEAPPEPREPLEPVDRYERWFGEEDGGAR